MPPKRKAKDSACTNATSASRARSARGPKTPAGSDGTDIDVLPTRPVKRTRGATSRATKQDDALDEDDFGSYGRASSKPATIEQHLMDQNKKSKEFIQGFKDHVAQGRDQVHDILAKLKQELTKPPTCLSANDNLPNLSLTLQTAAQTLTTKDNILFEQTQQLLRFSRAILACHQTAERDSRTADLTSPRETWKQDEEGMRKLLEYGKVYGEKVVEGWITPSPEDQDDESDSNNEDDEENMDEAENLARGLFEWRRKRRGLRSLVMGKGDDRKGESWGVAARRQMVALVGVIRTLLEKEE
ncbi:hypothetical protein VTI74DRAFT_5976 [Chaetomium olivicolor]